MDAGLKQRLIGAAVLVALAVIFLPMLVRGPAPDSGVSDLSMRVPDAPESGFKTVDLPLVVPADAPEGGVLDVPAPLDGDTLPTIDTAHAPPPQSAAAEGVRPPAPAGAAATTAAPASSALPATVAGGDYAVHFGAFASERDASLIVSQLADAGLQAYSEAFTLNDRQAQRVRLGPYASREQAEVVRARAAQVRNDVSPRVIALDVTAAPAQQAPVAAAPKPQATRPEAPVAAAKPEPKPAAKPEPAKPAAPVPTPAASNVGFAVQLGAFSKAEEAVRLRDRLRGQGIAAFTDTVNTDKGRLTRVKAGPVPTRADAERLRAQVKSRVGVDGMVRAQP